MKILSNVPDIELTVQYCFACVYENNFNFCLYEYFDDIWAKKKKTAL